MNIAIVNLQDINELQYTIDCLEFIDNEIIDAKIDVFTNRNLEDDIFCKFIRKLIPLRLDNLTFQDLNPRYMNLRYYSKNNKYHIAVDTEGSFKSAVSAYLLSGKTAGFRRSGFKGYLISKLYDETILFDNTKDVKILTFELLAKTFGFENKDIEIGY